MKKTKQITLLLFLLVTVFTLMVPVFATDVNSVKINYGLGADGLSSESDLSLTDSNILTKYRNIIVGATGLVTLTFLIFFIINFVKLGHSSGNPQARSQALMGIIWCGIGMVGVGGVTIFVAFFYNVTNQTGGGS